MFETLFTIRAEDFNLLRNVQRHYNQQAAFADGMVMAIAPFGCISFELRHSADTSLCLNLSSIVKKADAGTLVKIKYADDSCNVLMVAKGEPCVCPAIVEERGFLLGTDLTKVNFPQQCADVAADFVGGYKKVEKYCTDLSTQWALNHVALAPDGICATDRMCYAKAMCALSSCVTLFKEKVADYGIPFTGDFSKNLRFLLPRNLPFREDIPVKVGFCSGDDQTLVAFFKQENMVLAVRLTLDIVLPEMTKFEEEAPCLFSLTEEESKQILDILSETTADTVIFKNENGNLALHMRDSGGRIGGASYLTNIATTLNEDCNVNHDSFLKILRWGGILRFAMVNEVFYIKSDNTKLWLSQFYPMNIFEGYEKGCDYKVLNVRKPGVGDLLADSGQIGSENKSKLLCF